MEHKKIDINNWSRKSCYNNFINDTPCTYSMCVNIDITHLLTIVKNSDIKFFPTFLYALSNIINNHKEFRMSLDTEENLGYYDICNPCYTVFHKETETFTNVWTEYNENFNSFYKNYQYDITKYENDCENSKELKESNVFNVSCIPWTSFTGFNLNLQKGYKYLTPIFTIGKYFESDNKTLLPLAVQVHHAVCDGFHVSRFLNELQDWCNSFEIDTH